MQAESVQLGGLTGGWLVKLLLLRRSWEAGGAEGLPEGTGGGSGSGREPCSLETQGWRCQQNRGREHSSKTRSQGLKGTAVWGLPWWSMGWDSVLSLLRVQVQSLVRELRSCKLHSVAKRKKAQPFGNLPVGGKNCTDSSSCRLWNFGVRWAGVCTPQLPLIHCVMAGIVPNFSEPLFSHL